MSERYHKREILKGNPLIANKEERFSLAHEEQGVILQSMSWDFNFLNITYNAVWGAGV